MSAANPEEYFTKLTLSRTEPPGPLPEGTHNYDPQGDVLISLRALDGRVVRARLSIRDWSDALRLNRPVTAWLSAEQEEKDAA